MKLFSFKRILYSLVVSLLLIALFGCTDSSSGRKLPPTAEKTVETNPVRKLWVEQKPVSIGISEETGEEAKLTRNFYFILDGSGSMSEPTNADCGGDRQFSDKLQGAKWAVKKFLENVPDDVDIGLYVFDNTGKGEVVPLGSGNREAFITAVDEIQAGGGTPLARAISFGTDRLVEKYKKQLGYGEFRLVVVTDGKANQIPEAALYAAKYGIPIYTIGLCVGQDHPLRSYSVSYRAADNFADLSQGLQDTLAELPIFDVTRFEENLQ
jgi:hypothetical protein